MVQIREIGQDAGDVKLKRRQRDYYWRPMEVDGKDVWVRTELLPSDPVCKAGYLARGFRMHPPGVGEGGNTEVDALKELIKKQSDLIAQQTEALNLLSPKPDTAETQKEPEPPTEPEGGPRMPCPECQWSAPDPIALEKHMANKHHTTEEVT